MGVKIALAGNPNSGKTTLFNALTGSNQFVGNWPGVTVEKKEGKWKEDKEVVIMDLPGIYSLSPYTLEEVVARNYLITERPDAILNIVDGTNLERNLYLTTQLLELGIPVVMAINMMDIVRKNGDEINTKKLAEKLGCEVVTISALKGDGIKDAASRAVKHAGQKAGQESVHEFAPEVENYLNEIEGRLGYEIPEEQKRFYAIKLFERDDKIKDAMKNAPDVEDIIARAEKEMDDDAESIITNERYSFIGSIIGDCLKKNKTQELTTSDKIDRIVTNRWLALPIFAAVMWLVYYVSVTTVGSILTDWTNDTLFGEWIIPAAQSYSFPPLVGFGSNAALGHYEPGTAVLKPGDCILIDIGCVKDGYCSDMTRTFFWKDVTPEHRKVYETVRKANETAESIIRPGKRFCDLDNTARQIITDAGWGPFFTHRLGHSIGLEDHEFGDVSSTNTAVLEPGMTFSIEPGIYLEGDLGVRIEDLALVTENGAEVLNHFSKELQVLG